MAVATAPAKPRYHGLRVTREEYLDLEEDGFKYDVVDGVMIMAPSANFDHGRNSGTLMGRIQSYLRRNPIAAAATEVDVFLPDDGHVVKPDISIILNENLHIARTHIHGAPDVAIEITSPSTAHLDFGEKAERYLACGVKEYWIIDREEEQVHIWSNRGTEWAKQTGVEAASKILPGFILRKNEIFI